VCVTFVTCEVCVCGPRCHSGSSLYIYRVYLMLTQHLDAGPGGRARRNATAEALPNLTRCTRMVLRRWLSSWLSD